ncbi:MAG TPA: PAS domain S-box protein [Beijerinckiaceae bacterium]|jgi:PAS domain S-box-containing protein
MNYRPLPTSTERRFQLLVEAVTDYAIFMLEPDGTIASWNPGARRMKGYSADEALGGHYSMFFTEEDKARGLPEQALRTAAETGRYETEGWRVRRDGSRFWVAALLEAIRDADGTLLGFAKVTRDITERRAAREALRESEERFRILVDGVVDYAIFMLDPQGRVANWNSGAQRIKQYRAEEIVGEHFSRFYPPEDREAGVPARVLKTAEEEGRFEGEGWRVRRDGSRFWANVVIDAIRDESGKLLGFAKVTRDITERKEAQEKLAETREQLFQSQKMEAVGQLTGGIAHDFNNLLTVVLGGADIALRRSTDERVQRILRSIKDAAERGASLTQQLLAFSRRQTLRPEAIEVGRVLEVAVGLLRRSLRGDVTVALTVEPGLPRVKADPRQLELSVLNLGLNARDAMPAGGEIAVRAFATAAEPGTETSGPMVCIAISDPGVGMPEEVRARALEPFFTTKEVGKGSGLGLSQAYGFANQSGGSLTIESAVGHGTTVTLCLPATDEAATGAAPPDAGEASAPERRAILVVEDEPAVAAVAEQMLSDMGHSVRIAENAADALAVVEREPVDLVFSDIMMPGGMSGLELARAVRNRRPELPILLTTGYSEVVSGAVAHEFPIITKPYRQGEIAQAIERLLERPGASPRPQ